MKLSRALVLLGLAAIAAPCLGNGGQPQEAPDFPPEVAAHIPRNVEPYFLAFFVSPAEPKEMPFDLFVRHQAHLRRQFEAGVYRLAGPVTDEGRVRGLIILSAPSAEEARTVVEADPAVEEGFSR